MKTATPTKFKETEIGLIPEEWSVFNIGQLGKVVTGKTPARENSDDWGDGVDFVTPSDITLDEKYLSTVSRKISKMGSDRFKNMLIPAGSVMVTCIGSDMGKVVMNRKISLTNQQINSLIVKKDFDNNFVFYLLKNLYQTFWEYAGGGSTMPIVNKSAFESIGTAVPRSIDEQKQISEILSSLDDKIELNRKINTNLESLASALFKKWFVDIGDKLPDGWRMGTFGEAITNFDSKRVPLSSREREKRQGSYPYYGATSIMDYVDDFIFDGTYVLLGEDGSVAKEDGKPFVQYVHGKMWVNNHAHVLQGKNGFSTEYIKVFLDQVDIMPFVTGAVQPKLNQANMNSVPMVIPDQKTLGKFNEILSALFGMILENESQTKNLEQVRDSLLPRLMSGKIRV